MVKVFGIDHYPILSSIDRGGLFLASELFDDRGDTAYAEAMRRAATCKTDLWHNHNLFGWVMAAKAYLRRISS